jgi:hypothetical protein
MATHRESQHDSVCACEADVDAGLACTASKASRFGAWRERVPDHIEAIQRRLEGMIADAESRMSANGSILSYGMKIRRDTAEEILGFVKSLAPTAATDAPARDFGFDPVQTEPSTRRPPLEMHKRNAERFDARSISPPLTSRAALP